MGLFSLFRKNKQESASGQGEFFSRSAGGASTARNSSRAAGNSRKSVKADKDDSVDPVLPEKKRARRRLIGAVALVLAVVIVLPMILDSEPHPLGEDIAIQIPSRNGSEADKPKPVPAEPKEEFVDPATMNGGTGKPAIAPGAPAIAASTVVAPVTPAVPVQSPPPVADKPVEKPAEKAVPAEKPEARPVPKAEPKAEVKDSKVAVKPAPRKEEAKKDSKETAKPRTAEKSDKSDDAARALAILEGKTAGADKKHATAQAASGKFVIQVAALATQEKVDELRGKLSGAGIKSYTQKVATQSGDRTRIRVGPFTSREEADRMRAKINKLGLNATIVPA